jgi:Ca2+-binding RTX toxin-like protein
MNAHADQKTMSLTRGPQTPEGKGPVLHLHAPQSGPVHVPSSALLTQGDYARVGLDLMITGADGQQLLVQDYFLTDNPPALAADDGAQISGDLAERLAGSIAPGQLAQAGAGLAKQSIGQVENLNGAVNVVHADGTKGVLHKGDAVFQGDVLQTAKGAAVGVLFLDKTSLSLGSDGRMVLDQMVYDPGTGTGKSAFSLVQGSFSFVSGQIAKSSPDAMLVRTPVATIGIRGTLGSAGYSAEKGLTAALFSEGGSGTGELIISNQGGTQTINQPNQATQVLTFFTAPPAPVTVSPAQVQSYFGQVLQSLPPPPSNPEALKAVQQIQQQALEKGVQAGQMASQATGQAGESEIKVRQVASADQIAKDMMAQKAINALIDAKGISSAQDTGKEVKAGIDKAVSEGKSLADIGKIIGQEINKAAGLDQGGQKVGEGADHNKIEVVSRDMISQDGHLKTENIGDFMREVSHQTERLLGSRIADQITRLISQTIVTTVLQDNSVSSGTTDTTVFTDFKVGTSSSETLSGGTGNTEYIFYQGGGSSTAVFSGTTVDLSNSNFGGTDYLIEAASAGTDRVTFLNLSSILLRIRDVTTGDGYIEGDAMLNPTTTPTYGADLLHISTNIEQIQAYDGDLSNLDNSVILKNAVTKISGTSNYGYIWAGSDTTGSSTDETISMSDSAYFPNAVGSIIFGKAGNDNIVGTVDFLSGGNLGNGGNDIIYGGLGNDTINGSSGNNTMDGGGGTDWLSYGSADSVSIYVALGTSSHTDTTSSVTMTYADSFSNFEHYLGSSGADSFYFGSAFTTATSVTGGSGTDTMYLNGDYSSGVTFTNVGGVETISLMGGNSYNVTLGVDSSLTYVDGSNAGSVTLSGTSNGSGFSFHGSAGADSVTGGSSNDTLVGGSGNDSLNGYSSYDTLIGGLGSDTLTGGGGNDVFSYTGGTGASSIAKATSLGTDTITDFSHTMDKFVLSNATYGLGSSGNPLFFDGYASTADVYNTTASGGLDGNGTTGAGGGIFIVGTNAASQTVGVYFTTDVDAPTSGNSYQIATVTLDTAGAMTATDINLTT